MYGSRVVKLATSVLVRCDRSADRGLWRSRCKEWGEADPPGVKIETLGVVDCDSRKESSCASLDKLCRGTGGSELGQ